MGRGKSKKTLALIAAAKVILAEIQPASAIDDRFNHGAWNRAEVVERFEREALLTILSAWPGISRQAQKYDEGRP